MVLNWGRLALSLRYEAKRPRKKNAARDCLVDISRRIARIIHNSPPATPSPLTELGLTVRRSKSRIPAPSSAPAIGVQSVDASSVTIQIRACDALVRRKADGVRSAVVWAFFGENPPENQAGWRRMFQTGRFRATVNLPNSRTSNTLWICACWSNAKGEHGPSCEAVRVNLPAPSALPFEKEMLWAA